MPLDDWSVSDWPFLEEGDSSGHLYPTYTKKKSSIYKGQEVTQLKNISRNKLQRVTTFDISSIYLRKFETFLHDYVIISRN